MILGASVLSAVAMATVFNLAAGYLGYLPFGFYALYAVGSLITGVGIARWGFSAYEALAAAVLGGLALSSFFGALALRLRASYFAFGTFVFALGLQYIVATVFQAANIAYVTFTSTVKLSLADIYWSQLCVAAGTVIFVYALIHSKTGLAIKAIREDEDAARARGVNTGIVKFITLTAIGVTPALSGGLFALWYSYATIETSFLDSVVVQALVSMFVGGKGTIVGPVLGALMVSSLHSYLTEPYLADLAFAAAVIVIVLAGSGGLIGYIGHVRRLLRRANP